MLKASGSAACLHEGLQPMLSTGMAGSGGWVNKQIALFRNEKYYNCDLSSSYNIGARYWIGEILDYSKSLTGNSKVVHKRCKGHNQELFFLFLYLYILPP